MKLALPRGKRLARGRRAAWSLVDQGVSSVTNFALTIVAAHTLSPRLFGAFSAVYIVYIIVLQVSRSLVSEPLVVRFSAVSETEWKGAARESLGLAVALGALAGVVLASCGAALHGPLRSAALALAISLPGLLVQDAWRYAFFAQGRPARAAINDLVWLALQVVAFAVVLTNGWSSPGAFIIAWGLSGAVAGSVGVVQARVWPAVSQAWRWLRRHGDLGGRFAAEFLVYRSGVLLSTYSVGLVAGLSALGSLRAAQVLFGPVMFLFLGLEIIAVPEGVRVLQEGPRGFRRKIRNVSMAAGAVAAAWGGVVLLLPPSLGRMALGANWALAHRLLLPIAVATVAAGVSIGPWAGLRALQAARDSLRVRVLTAPFVFVLGVSGALVGAALGAAIGLAVAGCLTALVWWWTFASRGRVALADEGAPPMNHKSTNTSSDRVQHEGTVLPTGDL